MCDDLGSNLAGKKPCLCFSPNFPVIVDNSEFLCLNNSDKNDRTPEINRNSKYCIALHRLPCGHPPITPHIIAINGQIFTVDFGGFPAATWVKKAWAVVHKN